MRYLQKKAVSSIPPTRGSVADTWNIDDKTTNAPSIRLVEEQMDAKITEQLAKLIYPIGRGFIDFTDTDYSNYLGLTWERELVGMFPVGYKSGDTDFGTMGKTGGEKTHTLTINEMPSHNHSITDNGHTHTISHAISQTKGTQGTSNFVMSSGNYTTTTTNAKTGISINNTGGGQAHNNLPPYQVVAYWKRIA